MSFARTQAVLRGERVPLVDVATKVLFFVHRDPDCDVVITPGDFVLEFGGASQRYILDVGPPIVSWFLANAPAGYLPAGTLRNWADKPGRWAYGPCNVWIEATDERITVMIRRATRGDAQDRAVLAVPPPMKPPDEFVVGAHPCPHCGEVPDRYRKLLGGGLICLACGASSSG